MNKVGICYHNRSNEAAGLAHALAQAVRGVVSDAWLCAAWDDETAARNLPGTDLVVTVGGDGTILWTVRAALTHSIPVLGVSMGNLAFLAELSAEEAVGRLPTLLQGEWRIEERTTLQAEVISPDIYAGPYYAVNDVVVSRGAIGRPISLRVTIEGTEAAIVRSDGVIVATATGSTAYSLAVGGPVLPPQSSDLVLNFVAPHMAMTTALVLPNTAGIEIQAEADDHQAILSVDGQINRPLMPDETVRIGRGPYLARFLRLRPPTESYRALARQLGWLPRDVG